MSLHAHLIVVLLLATVLTPLLGTLPLRGWRWDRQCWWLLGLLSIGMPLAAGQRFSRILLPGVGAMFSAVLLAGLDAALRAERQGAAGPSLWWRWLARAFAAAGLWVGLALAVFASDVKRNGEILVSTAPTGRAGSGLGFLFVTALVAALLFALGWPDGRRAAGEPGSPRCLAREPGTTALYRLLGAALLFGLLAAALWLPWSKLQAVGHDVLGYLGFEGFAGEMLHSDREAAKPVLAALASVTLSLWGFQALWARLGTCGRRSP
jgi:hypothetical protein